ncbi:hypothetical protein [Bacillus sp. S/N-304-OC-R1]|uniref:hypothetical protein n=1 Tax=Bacillus sp. S/N-304-OC-R1 TaxID=2758034 RepID=UPI001C8D4340|nr:hypothetical protein [Bacillus sp. S/N-304-OC-R1]MBY0121463.1 hypothetical protein [Bacillus sp. S/N-304-OC-R1]
MPKTNTITFGTITGILSGLFLGLFLKIIQMVFGVKVYTLLLNIDYIPYLKDLTLHESIEFLLHIFVSIILAIILLQLSILYKWTRSQIFTRTVLSCFLIGVILYPTTALSERTPSITSISGVTAWLIGHLLYGVVLALFFIRKRSR